RHPPRRSGPRGADGPRRASRAPAQGDRAARPRHRAGCRGRDPRGRRTAALCRRDGRPAHPLMAAPAPPLAGVRVVEWTEGLAGSFAGFLLTTLGAEVVTIESQAAHPTPASRVLDRAKRSVDATCWNACARGADLTITDESGPAVAAADGLVTCRVTTWGDLGAPGGLPAEEPLVAAMTGVQAMQWSWSGRPVWIVTPMVSYMTGMLAAVGVVGALFARRRGAPGQSVRVSHLDGVIALNSGTYVTGADHAGRLLQGGDPRGVYP